MEIEIPTEIKTPLEKESPSLSLEEIQENEKCSSQEKNEIQTIFKQGTQATKKFSTALSKEIQETPPNNPQKEVLKRKIFLLAQKAIQTSTNRELGENSETHIILTHLGRKNLLRQMNANQGMALAICSLRAKDPIAFKKIIFNFKTIPKSKSIPDAQANIELLAIKTKDGQTLGHLAAQKDIQEAVQYIACNHRNLLELRDKDGNTLVHTASKYLSAETIQYLLGLSKKLFGRKNKEGKTPLDLEGGPGICKSIATMVIEQDTKIAEETLRKALDVCDTIQKKTPKKEVPPVLTPIDSPKLKMETLSIT